MKIIPDILLLNFILIASLITLSILVRIDYFRNRKRRIIGNIVHAFFFRNLYDDYDQIIEDSEKSEWGSRYYLRTKSSHHFRSNE